MPRVLIADDSQSNRELLSFLLAELRFETVAVENGEKAVEKALESSFDLLLLDINMPVMGGEEAVQTLRSLNYGGAIAACSAESEADEIERIMALGFDGWLQKPVDPDRLNQLLTQFNLEFEQNTSGNDAATEEKIQQLSAQFKKNLPNLLAQLEKAVAEHSLNRIKGIAHQLKGVAGTFGFPILGNLAASIEKAVKSGQIEEAMERTDLLVNKLRKTKQESVQ